MLWDFAFLGPVDLESISPAALSCDWQKTPVPSAFDALPDHAGKRGAGVYRTRFAVPVGRAARLEFGAVSMWCRVFVDGVALKDHACGYAPFTVEVPAAKPTHMSILAARAFFPLGLGRRSHRATAASAVRSGTTPQAPGKAYGHVAVPSAKTLFIEATREPDTMVQALPPRVCDMRRPLRRSGAVCRGTFQDAIESMYKSPALVTTRWCCSEYL